MIIARLDLKAFGRFSDVSLDLLAGGTTAQGQHATDDGPRRCFHLIYGPNESGKSTSLRAITSLLFGMSHITEDNYLHANAQMRVGGLLIDQSGKQLECVRRRGRKATLRDADDSEPIDESLLQEMLGGINRETFLTRFGLSHDELVTGGEAITSGEGDLGQILFAAGAGVGRLRDIQNQLDEASSRLFTPRGSKPAINAALRDLDEKRKELRRAQIPPAEFSGLQQRLEEKRQQSSRLGQQMQDCVSALSRLRNYEQALPLLPQWRLNIQALQEFKSAPLLDEAFTERRRQVVSDREVAISRQAELESRIADLSSRLDGIPVDHLVMNHESEIQAIFQEVAARDKADRDRIELIRLQRNIDRKIVDLLRQLSVEIDHLDGERDEAISQSVERLRVSDALRNQIRQLAGSYQRLISQRNDASDAVETTKRRLADASGELESMGAPGDPTVLTSAIEAVGDPQVMLEAIAEQQQNCDQLRSRCEEMLRRLSGFSGTLQQAAALQVPDQVVTSACAQSLRTSHRQLLACEDLARQLRTQRDAIRQQVEQQQAAMPLPTAEELSEARRHRDSVVDRLADSSLNGDAARDMVGELRRCIGRTDQLADTMCQHHEQVHQRQTLRCQIDSLDTQIAEAESSEKQAKSEFEMAKQQWLQLWDSCGVAAGQPEQMQRWLSDHEQLQELVSQLRMEEKRCEHSRTRLQRAATRLRSVLATATATNPVGVATNVQGGLFDDPPEVDLMALYDEAVSLRSSLARTRQQYDAVARRRDELAEQLPEAETRFEATQNHVQQWRADWRRATESFVQSDRAGTDEVLQMLDQIGELCSKKRERDILARRIQSIGEDDLAYAARVRRIAAATRHCPIHSQDHAQRIGDDRSPTDAESDVPEGQADPSLSDLQSPTAIAHALYQRLQAERTSLRSRDTLREQIESSKQRLLEVAAQRSACDAALKQLCVEAGCGTPDELPEIERAARQRIGLQASLRDLENQLSILAGDGPLDQFIDAAGQQQPANLQVSIERKEAELGQLREDVAAVEQEIGALRHEINRMDGSSRASELAQTIQFTAAQIGRDAEEYARIKTASFILRRAIDHYREANQSPVLAHANRYFAQLTCGEYRELKPDYDAKGRTTLFGIRADGPAVAASVMSSGTADALYLALRLASLQHQTSHGSRIPLIIDDCLVQLDDDRAVAALRALSQLSETTQVILLTHHAHLKTLAAQHLGPRQVHVHHLGA